MAVTYDTSSVFGIRDAGSSVTVSHVSNANTNLHSVIYSSNSNQSISSVTFNGVAMTYDSYIAGAGGRWFIYKLLNSPTTTANVVVTMSSAITAGRNVTVMNTSVTKNDVVAPINAYSSGVYSGPVLNIAVTPTIANSLLLSFWYSYGIVEPSVGAGQTAYNRYTNGVEYFGMSYKTATVVQTENMFHSQSSGSYGDGGAIALRVINTNINATDTTTSTETVSFLRGRLINIIDSVSSPDVVSIIKSKWNNAVKAVNTWTNQPKN